jgi:RNA polymerase sigma-70 factor (ECF subfamily)
MWNSDVRIEEHIPRLRRYARALTGDHARADDLVQDTLERAWSKFSLWRRGSDLRAWLFSIMHNVFVNQIAGGRASAAFLPLADEAFEVAVDGKQEQALELRDLTSALTKLSTEHREVLLLVALEDLPYEAVAKVLNIPLGTVMSRLSRARERLRELMAAGAQPVLRRVK